MSGASKVRLPTAARSSGSHRHVGALGDSAARRRSARACRDSPRCASDAPSFSWTSACTIDSGCTTTSMRLVGEAEQVVRLDQLEPLVHQRGRVDRDLAAHVPGRVRERRLDVHVAQLVGRHAAERAAGGGQHEPLDRRRAASPAAAGRAPSARSRRGSRARRSPPRAASRARRRPRGSPCWRARRRCPRRARRPSAPSPAEPTRPFSTRSAPDSAISRTMPSGPASTSPPVQASRRLRGRVLVGECDARHADARAAWASSRSQLERPPGRRPRARRCARRRRAPACRSSRSSRGSRACAWRSSLGTAARRPAR